MFGQTIGSVKKGMAILIAMTLLFVPLLGLGIWSEIGGNPCLYLSWDRPGTIPPPARGQHGGGKEIRFGIVPSAAFPVITTVTSCGAVNSMHDSFMPLGGLVQIFDIQLGEIVYGGVGSRLYPHARVHHHRDVYRRARRSGGHLNCMARRSTCT